MTNNFINIVTVKVKRGLEKKYIEKINKMTKFEGLVSCKHVAIDSNTYCVIEEWTSKVALMKARKTIELANEVQPLINEKSSEIDVTGFIGGKIISEKNIEKNKTEETRPDSFAIEKIGNKHFYFLYSNY